jgi:hypothetical protein
MMLFKARQVAKAELESQVERSGISLEAARQRIEQKRRLRSSVHRPPHVFAGTATNCYLEAIQA